MEREVIKVTLEIEVEHEDNDFAPVEFGRSLEDGTLSIWAREGEIISCVQIDQETENQEDDYGDELPPFLILEADWDVLYSDGSKEHHCRSIEADLKEEETIEDLIVCFKENFGTYICQDALVHNKDKGVVEIYNLILYKHDNYGEEYIDNEVESAKLNLETKEWEV